MEDSNTTGVVSIRAHTRTAWQTAHGEWRLIGNNPHSGNNHPGFFAPIYAAKAFTTTNANFTYLLRGIDTCMMAI
jgi:hypothetical protein